MSSHRSPSEVRASLKHPIIDGDGHWVEYNPVFAERMRKLAGDKAADGFLVSQRRIPDALKLSIAERKQRGIAMEGYWTRQSSNTRDRATAMMPRLLYDRLDELGIDFGIIYPTAGLSVPRIPDDATRRAVCRGFNLVTADYFDKLGDRLTPAAVIPMFTPEEAIEELEFCVKQLGAKVAMFGNAARRMAKAKDVDSDLARHTVTFERFGIDSDYDYDAVWQKCRELGIAPTFHAGGRGFGLRNSPSNFTYNHIGHFAAAGHAVSKAIFLGGVTRRFPELRFAFLEGGVGWACQLFGDLIEHWERRNGQAMQRMDPRTLDRALLMNLVEKFGDDDVAAALHARDGWPDNDAALTGGVEDLDDFSACKITRKEDWVDLYAKPFYFGCEADDRTNGWAFSPHNPFGAMLHALYSSDIGHFDVIDMRDPLAEAHELVEDGVITSDNFRDFAFANAVHLWGTQNPRFFEGTTVAAAAREELARTAT